MLSEIESRIVQTFVCYESILTFGVKLYMSETCLVRGSDILPA